MLFNSGGRESTKDDAGVLWSQAKRYKENTIKEYQVWTSYNARHVCLNMIKIFTTSTLFWTPHHPFRHEHGIKIKTISYNPCSCPEQSAKLLFSVINSLSEPRVLQQNWFFPAWKRCENWTEVKLPRSMAGARGWKKRLASSQGCVQYFWKTPVWWPY